MRCCANFKTHKRSGDTGSALAIAVTATDTAVETSGRSGDTKIVTLRTVYTVLMKPDLPPRGTKPLKRNVSTLKHSTQFLIALFRYAVQYCWEPSGKACSAVRLRQHGRICPHPQACAHT